MNSRYQGPAVFPPAAEVRKRVEEHLDNLLAGEPKAGVRAEIVRKKGRFKRRKLRRRP